MADEEKNEQQPEETQAEETPAVEEETPTEVESPAAEADSEDVGGESAEGDDGSSDGGAEQEPAAEGEEGAAEAEAGPAEDEGLDWKARRRLERSRQPAEQRAQQSPAERAQSRGEGRRQAARRRSSYRVKSRTKRQAGTGTPPAERRSAGRKVRQGRVVSSKPDKTITVEIEVARRHPQYEKIVRRSRTLHAHDAQNEAGEGDLVRVIETRPLSRTKRWRLVEILEKAK